MSSFLASVRLAAATIAVCIVGYVLVILAIGQVVSPGTAQGSLVRKPDGTVIGGRLIAQDFAKPEYFWPRPSAVDYKGDAAGGSNKSPTSPDLTARAAGIVAEYGATAANPLPPELAAASGGGLDPHISEHAALYQAHRVAVARGLTIERVQALVRRHGFAAGGPLAPDRLVNVLELNLALDRETGAA